MNLRLGQGAPPDGAGRPASATHPSIEDTSVPTCPPGEAGPELVCPRCGLLARGVRCPRCDAVKLTACSGDCAACRASCG